MEMTNVTSTKVKVNVEKVAEILLRYELEDIQFLLDNEGYLEVIGEEGSFQGWPGAVPVESLPNKECYENEEEYWDDLWCTFSEEGSDGLTALLQELAFCIDSPLMILVASSGDHQSCESCVWRIEPGSEQVELLSASDGRWNVADDNDEE